MDFLYLEDEVKVDLSGS